MSGPWPGRVVDDDEQWPGRVIGPAPVRARGKDTTRRKTYDPSGPLYDVEAVDGDTLKTDEARVRVYGADAPELTQRGWDRQGNAVPIGEQSRDWLRDRISIGPVDLGDVKGVSYGRLVGPVSLNGTDAALSSVRTGNALAAPAYVRDDPTYRFKLMEAERLARQNGLGPMNDTLAQNPADQRRNPDWVPERETIAQWFDTPTPYAGMRPEAEKQYVALQANGTAKEIVDFATAQGLGIDPDEVAKWVAWRDEQKAAGKPFQNYPNYQRGPEVMQQLGDGASGAGVRGFGQGFLAGGLDEAGAVADTLLPNVPGLQSNGPRENVWNSDRRLADVWANNQFQNASILRGDNYAHPTASTIGEMTGGLISGVVIPVGAGARTAGELGRVGLGYGALGGFLSTDGGVSERLKGAAIGAPVGMVLNAGVGKAIEKGAPLIGRGVRSVLGRDGTKAAETAGEVAGEYVDETAFNAAQAAPEGIPGDVWPGRVVGESEANRVAEIDSTLDPAVSPRSIAMEADSPFESATVRQRDYLDLTARPRPLLDPASDAERVAAAARVQPGDVLPIASNEVDGPAELAAAQAGRFAEAKAPNERSELSRGVVRSWYGAEVPKVGPTDMIGWLRLRGGLKNEGGELGQMGFTNAARRGLDHVGQEARFGPLVNNKDGASLDDAALAAWEAGFFPELTERPSVNQFLDALHETYNGGANRRFLPDDYDQLERYTAAQADRYSLEQQQLEVGGPVYQDRSLPADSAAPFPPPQAYEEWPSDAIQRVGNVDVTKLDTPQDIRRALKQSYNAMGGFDAATRGRITQAETANLAADLGMTADDLLARRKGQAFNAEEALAARQILAKSGNELVNAAKRVRELGDDPGSEALADFRQKWMRHVAIQEQVSGMTAEAGRTLQQFRMAASSRALRADVLSSFVNGGGGKDNLRDAANTLLEAVEESPGKFNVLSEKLTRPKWRNKVGEFYINMLLTNPPTHAVNMVSNTLTAIGQVPEYALASAIGGARRAIIGKNASDRILASEVGARTFGLIQGTKEGMALFGRALRTGEPDDFVSKVEGQQFKAINGLKGEIVRAPTRLLTAEDQLFKGVARRMAINGLAMRKASREGLRGDALAARVAELTDNPPDDILHAAMDEGLYRTFQSQLGEFGQAVSKMSNSNLPAKIIIPFVRTPINLMKYATERSPAAPLLKEWRADFAAGGERRDLATAKMLLGWGFMATIYSAAQNGLITGAVPPDPKKAKLLYADGWQPYSIKVGDRYVSYSRLDPLATTIGVAADMATLPSGMSDRQRTDMGVMLVASVMGNLASKTWLSGASAFTEALADPARNAKNWLERTAGAIAVPAGVAGVARAIDPVARKREGVGDAIMARVPGMSDDLLPQRDVFGEPVVGNNLGPDFLSPFWTSKSKRDPVVAEMLRIGAGVSAPGKQYTEDGERVDYTPEQYDRYHEIAGRLTYNRLTALIGSDTYRTLTDNARRKAVKKELALARKRAREVLADPDYPLPAKGAAVDASASSDQWPGRPVGGTAVAEDAASAWPGKPVASRDVVGELQKAIPGIRFTSGFRTPEYNASLKARGYHPADNSEHLDGAALDMLPPPGKTLSWLRAQVKRYDPKARLLVHDGHLHAGFDGFYDAPKLGGMAAR